MSLHLCDVYFNLRSTGIWLVELSQVLYRICYARTYGTKKARFDISHHNCVCSISVVRNDFLTYCWKKCWAVLEHILFLYRTFYIKKNHNIILSIALMNFKLPALINTRLLQIFVRPNIKLSFSIFNIFFHLNAKV